MAYDPELERRLDACLRSFPSELRDQITKKKMFGGLAYLYSGKMTVGIVNDELMVRVVADKMENTLKMPNVRPMDFTKRPMKGFVFVSGDGIGDETQLLHWMELGIEHAKDTLNQT